MNENNHDNKKIRILFVDDDPMLLSSTRRQLFKKLQDCELLFFESASEALEDIELSTPHIVLSDVRMPEMDGAEFLQGVSKTNPATVRLAWTGQSGADQLDRVFDVAHQVFSKPCPTEKLFDLISTVVQFCRDQADETNVDAELLSERLATFEDVFIAPTV